MDGIRFEMFYALVIERYVLWCHHNWCVYVVFLWNLQTGINLEKRKTMRTTTTIPNLILFSQAGSLENVVKIDLQNLLLPIKYHSCSSTWYPLRNSTKINVVVVGGSYENDKFLVWYCIPVDSIFLAKWYIKLKIAHNFSASNKSTNYNLPGLKIS